MVTSKAELRVAGFKKRDAIPRDEQERFAQRLVDIGPQLVRDLSPVPIPIVSLYSPIGSEPDVGPFAATLLASGIRIVLPVDWSSGGPLIYREWHPGDRMALGPLGIAEPLEGQPEYEPDVLFIPVAAFDRRGHRIGYGAGSTDSTLASHRARRAIHAVGVAFALQEVPEVPAHDGDQPLDTIVTESGILPCRR